MYTDKYLEQRSQTRRNPKTLRRNIRTKLMINVGRVKRNLQSQPTTGQCFKQHKGLQIVKD